MDLEYALSKCPNFDWGGGCVGGGRVVRPGVPRQLGDAILCPQVTGERWREPLVHGLLHLLGFDHGSEMKQREARWTE